MPKKKVSKKKALMGEAVGEVRERIDEPRKSPEGIPSAIKVTDFSPSAGRYVRQQRVSVQVRVGHKTIFKENVSSFHIVSHRDQFLASGEEDRHLLVESDETTFVIVASKHDLKNIAGRGMRQAGVKSLSTLDETLSRAVNLAKRAGEDDHQE